MTPNRQRSFWAASHFPFDKTPRRSLNLRSMQPEIVKLLAEIKAHLAKTGMAETTFGRKVVNDGKFIKRLEGGGQLFPATSQRVRDWMRANKPPRKRKSAA
jgi:hypothetical protein